MHRWLAVQPHRVPLCPGLIIYKAQVHDSEQKCLVSLFSDCWLGFDFVLSDLEATGASYLYPIMDMGELSI
jgi:hypothetical protein